MEFITINLSPVADNILTAKIIFYLCLFKLIEQFPESRVDLIETLVLPVLDGRIIHPGCGSWFKDKYPVLLHP